MTDRRPRTGTATSRPNRCKDQVYRTHLLRRSYREDGNVKNETLGNLSHLPDCVIDLIRRSLQGETFVPVGEAFESASSRAHGHVAKNQSLDSRCWHRRGFDLSADF